MPRLQIELDHLFVCTAPGAPEAEKLVQLGLHEGPPNQHPGQGTACRRFSFVNAMIELFWVNDAREAQSESTRRTCFGRDGLSNASQKIIESGVLATRTGETSLLEIEFDSYQRKEHVDFRPDLPVIFRLLIRLERLKLKATCRRPRMCHELAGSYSNQKARLDILTA